MYNLNPEENKGLLIGSLLSAILSGATGTGGTLSNIARGIAGGATAYTGGAEDIATAKQAMADKAAAEQMNQFKMAEAIDLQNQRQQALQLKLDEAKNAKDKQARWETFLASQYPQLAGATIQQPTNQGITPVVSEGPTGVKISTATGGQGLNIPTAGGMPIGTIAAALSLSGDDPVLQRTIIEKTLFPANVDKNKVEIRPFDEEGVKVYKYVETKEGKERILGNVGVKSAIRQPSTTVNVDLGKKYLTPQELESVVTPDNLNPFPVGTTWEEAKQAGAISVSPTVREKLYAIDSSKEIVQSIDALSDTLIKAKTAPSAGLQGAILTVGGWTNLNQVAGVYKATISEFAGQLARTFGGEKGVLTNEDIQRVLRGLPVFGDTKAMRDYKMAMLNNLMVSAQNSQKKIYIGQQSVAEGRKDLKKLIIVMGGKPSVSEVIPTNTVKDITGARAKFNNIKDEATALSYVNLLKNKFGWSQEDSRQAVKGTKWE